MDIVLCKSMSSFRINMNESIELLSAILHYVHLTVHSVFLMTVFHPPGNWKIWNFHHKPLSISTSYSQSFGSKFETWFFSRAWGGPRQFTIQPTGYSNNNRTDAMKFYRSNTVGILYRHVQMSWTFGFRGFSVRAFIWNTQIEHLWSNCSSP